MRCWAALCIYLLGSKWQSNPVGATGRSLPLGNTIFMLYGNGMNARQIMDILQKNGWRLARISGSHHIFTKVGQRNIPIPVHGNKDLGIFGKSILAQAGIKEK